MGTKETHAFVRNLEQCDAPRRRTIGKLVRRFLNFFYYLELSLSLFFVYRGIVVSVLNFYFLPIYLLFLISSRIIMDDTIMACREIIITGQGHEVREPLGNRID